MSKNSVVFFGSGPVAAQSLKLLSEWAAIEAVVTKPQPPHHKESFPVLELAKKLNLPIYTPQGKAALSELIASGPFTSQLGLVIDYGFIINQDVIDSFPLGIINSHFSLLPEWRGADPITFAILSGQQRTGVSLMRIVAAMDEGPLLAFGIQEIDPAMTAPSLTQRLILLSDGLLRVEVPRYFAGETKVIPQEEVSKRLLDYPATPSYSRKLTKEDGILDWNKPAAQLEREIRAFIEWPKSRATFSEIDLVITKAHVVSKDTATPTNASSGSLFVASKQLYVVTGDGILMIDELKPAGKQAMTAQAFLAGYAPKLPLIPS
jgi:methionyl-tRNA formyltransferase